MMFSFQILAIARLCNDTSIAWRASACCRIALRSATAEIAQNRFITVYNSQHDEQGAE
jgi:hypothetical protein